MTLEACAAWGVVQGHGGAFLANVFVTGVWLEGGVLSSELVLVRALVNRIAHGNATYAQIEATRNNLQKQPTDAVA